MLFSRKKIILLPISTPSVLYFSMKSRFQSMNFLRSETLATMGLNRFEPVQPPTDKSTFVLLACACSTTFGRDDSTAQSSGNEGKLFSLFKMAKAVLKGLDYLQYTQSLLYYYYHN